MALQSTCHEAFPRNLCTLTCGHVKLCNLRMLLPLSGADNNDQGRKEGGTWPCGGVEMKEGKVERVIEHLGFEETVPSVRLSLCTLSLAWTDDH